MSLSPWVFPVAVGIAILATAALLLVIRRRARARRTRTELRRELDQLAAAERESPDDDAIRLACARALYESGEFTDALERVAPLAERQDAEGDALSLFAQLAYLTGSYERAVSAYGRLLAAPRRSRSARLQDQIGLGLAYYQVNRFAEIRQIPFPRSARFPELELVRAFDHEPYALSWSSGERCARVPFALSDPLPLLTVEFNGVPVTAIFDTGADMFIVDDEIATELGVERVTSGSSTFGGGKRGAFGMGKLEQVRMGDALLEHVPVMTLPVKRFSEALGGKHTTGGFVGTAALRQFLATVDYECGQLVLRERGDAGREALERDLADRQVTEVPFALASTHLLMAQGALDGCDGLTFFVDSGLASDAAFSAPRQTLEHAGIPVPDQEPPRGPGGGGGAWASGRFPIQRLALGELSQTDLVGEYGALTPETYWDHGFIMDGLISHGFLRRYASWTLDFDRMRFVFAT